MVKIHTRDLQKKLKSCANSPKQYTVKVKRSRYSSKIHRYALVKARVHENTAVVTYDTLRDFIARLPRQTISITIDPQGLHIIHQTGALLLRHIPGEWEDLKEISMP